MKYLFVISLFSAVFSDTANGQFSVESKSRILSHLIDGNGYCVPECTPPTASTKGKLSFYVRKEPWFFQYGESVMKRNVDIYQEFINNYVLKDSAKFYDTAFVSFANSQDLKQGKTWLLARPTGKDDVLPVWKRTVFVMSILGVSNFIDFIEVDAKSSDIALIIMAEDWKVRNDVWLMGRYAEAAALLIYEYLIGKDVDKYRDILITVIKNGLKSPIYQKSYNLKESNLFQQNYPKK